MSGRAAADPERPPARAGDVVVLVHGLWMRGLVMQRLAGRLRRDAGLRPRIFSYLSIAADLESNLARLRRFIAGQGDGPVHLVGHSLGGVLALQALAGLAAPPPGRLVCLGSPLRGSAAACRLANWPGGSALLGRTLRTAVLEHPLPRCPDGLEVGVIAGDVPLGLGRILPDLPAPNDGVVAVSETRLPGIRDHLVVHASHSWLLFSAEVAVQTAAFLATGQFRRAAAA